MTPSDYRASARVQCDHKKSYRTKRAAKAQVRRYDTRGVHGLHPYECPHCGAWHLGHEPWLLTQRKKHTPDLRTPQP